MISITITYYKIECGLQAYVSFVYKCLGQGDFGLAYLNSADLNIYRLMEILYTTTTDNYDLHYSQSKLVNLKSSSGIILTGFFLSLHKTDPFFLFFPLFLDHQ